MQLRTPVLLIVFNRPSTTKQVFQMIRKARPLRLYVAADGPRSNRVGDSVKVEKARRIATDVDWPCNVSTLIQKRNLGCKLGPSTAISWFFNKEEEGIILEDDCVPSQSFFQYCQDLLERYRHDKEIWHICGNNFGYHENSSLTSMYSFGSFAQVWGWATWRDRWVEYVGNPFYLKEQNNPKSWPISWLARLNKSRHLLQLMEGLDAWSYQWHMTVLNNKGFVVYPTTNLIQNIGDGDEATHTKQVDRRLRLTTGELKITDKYPAKERDVAMDKHYAANMGLVNYAVVPEYFMSSLRRIIDGQVSTILRSCLRRADYAIVISSSGRAGSTMLYRAVAESWFRQRSRVHAKGFPGFNFQIIQELLWRLDTSVLKNGTVTKTHDLPPADIAYRTNVKYVFIYSDPLDTYLSVEKEVQGKGEIWLDEHLFHLRSSGKLDDLYTRDILNYEQQVKSWTSLKSPNVFCVRYEELWESLDDLSLFLGFVVQLPAKNIRSNKSRSIQNFNHKLFERLREVYDAAK